MTRDDIIRMAREAQQEDFASDTGHWFKMEAKDLERFARLVAEHEREQCAQVCDAIDTEYDGEDVLATWCAEDIRARGSND